MGASLREMPDDDSYERHQVLAALTGVLLHDLRNPLHSATLLVEALGAGGDVNALRTKLRAQFAKLDALISTAAVPIREMTIEPRLARSTLGELFDTVTELARRRAATTEMTLAVAGPRTTSVVSDRALLARAIWELCAHVAEEQPPAGRERGPVALEVKAEGSNEKSVRIAVGSPGAVIPEAVQKAPFTLATGGLRLALARALSQMSGAAMRLERQADGTAQYVVTAPRDEARILG